MASKRAGGSYGKPGYFHETVGPLAVPIEDKTTPCKRCPSCGFRIKTTKYGELKAHAYGGHQAGRNRLPLCDSVMQPNDGGIPEFVARENRYVTRKMIEKKYNLNRDQLQYLFDETDSPQPVGVLETRRTTLLYEADAITEWMEELL